MEDNLDSQNYESIGIIMNYFPSKMQTQQKIIIKYSPEDNSNDSRYSLEDTESPMLSGTVAKGDTFKVQL